MRRNVKFFLNAFCLEVDSAKNKLFFAISLRKLLWAEVVIIIKKNSPLVKTQLHRKKLLFTEVDIKNHLKYQQIYNIQPKLPTLSNRSYLSSQDTLHIEVVLVKLTVYSIFVKVKNNPILVNRGDSVII